jgi:hypothetical protein
MGFLHGLELLGQPAGALSGLTQGKQEQIQASLGGSFTREATADSLTVALDHATVSGNDRSGSQKRRAGVPAAPV